MLVEKYSVISGQDRSANSTPELHDHSHRSAKNQTSKYQKEDDELNGRNFSYF
jgi:hypothetical protein